ncbi:hypothetical protein DFH06DRAFT_1208393 [Mycena polygramma]|nr:hypothetical protein DFH06DRAFT_1208393 [Mycena polygramma]
MLLLRGLVALWAAFARPQDRTLSESSSIRDAEDRTMSESNSVRDAEDPYHLFTCCICIDTFTSPVVTTCCMHIFCEECLQDLQAPTCPWCRAPLVVEECIRDALFERELSEAIENGLVSRPE